jgi:hypothetical protein
VKFEIFGDFEGSTIRGHSEREGAVRLDARQLSEKLAVAWAVSLRLNTAS